MEEASWEHVLEEREKEGPQGWLVGPREREGGSKGGWGPYISYIFLFFLGTIAISCSIDNVVISKIYILVL